MRKPLPPINDVDIQATPEGIKWLEAVRSHVIDIRSIEFTWNPASLAANTHAEQTVTVTGISIGDTIVALIKPTFTQGFMVGQGRASAANTLAVQVVNGTGAASDPGSETYTVVFIKNSRA